MYKVEQAIEEIRNAIGSDSLTEYPSDEALTLALVALRKQEEEAAAICTFEGYALDELQLVTALLRRHYVTPETLHQIASNLKAAFEVVEKDMVEAVKRSVFPQVGL